MTNDPNQCPYCFGDGLWHYCRDHKKDPHGEFCCLEPDDLTTCLVCLGKGTISEPNDLEYKNE